MAAPSPKGPQNTSRSALETGPASAASAPLEVVVLTDMQSAKMQVAAEFAGERCGDWFLVDIPNVTPSLVSADFTTQVLPKEGVVDPRSGSDLVRLRILLIQYADKHPRRAKDSLEALANLEAVAAAVPPVPYKALKEAMTGLLQGFFDGVKNLHKNQFYTSNINEIPHVSRDGFIPETDGGMHIRLYRLLGNVRGAGEASLLPGRATEVAETYFREARKAAAEEVFHQHAKAFSDLGVATPEDAWDVDCEELENALHDAEYNYFGDLACELGVKIRFYAPNSAEVLAYADLYSCGSGSSTMDSFLSPRFTFTTLEEFTAKAEAEVERAVEWLCCEMDAPEPTEGEPNPFPDLPPDLSEKVVAMQGGAKTHLNKEERELLMGAFYSKHFDIFKRIATQPTKHGELLCWMPTAQEKAMRRENQEALCGCLRGERDAYLVHDPVDTYRVLSQASEKDEKDLALADGKGHLLVQGGFPSYEEATKWVKAFGIRHDKASDLLRTRYGFFTLRDLNRAYFAHGEPPWKEACSEQVIELDDAKLLAAALEHHRDRESKIVQHPGTDIYIVSSPAHES